jgi:hypothetical protein
MIPAMRRPGAFLVVLGCLGVLVPSAASPVAASADWSRPVTVSAGAAAAVFSVPASALGNPSKNTEPSAAFYAACRVMGTSKSANDKCDAAALKDFNAVRKQEGLGPMTLPGDFDALSVRAQLLAISNIERLDRGRRAVVGLSTRLDSLAAKGATADEDPAFPSPFPGTAGSGNWVGGVDSALLADFLWMYDDGPGSGNIDCQHKGAPGCWGHRKDIIRPFDAPLILGTGVAHKTKWGTSMTELFIGGDHTDHANVSPTWAAIAKTFPVLVSRKSVSLSAASGATKRAKVVVRAPDAAKHITASISAGAASWAVSPASCTLAVNARCTLTLTYRASAAGSHPGSLVVTGTGGHKAVVTLTGTST